jgi:hypothetical protein
MSQLLDLYLEPFELRPDLPQCDQKNKLDEIGYTESNRVHRTPPCGQSSNLPW